MTTDSENNIKFDAVSFRKKLHQHPELSDCEFNTAQYIYAQLVSFGYTPQKGIGGNGLVCVADSGKEGQTTLLRADFDALPIQETATHKHISVNKGVMHACGHDGHTATLLIVAEQLSQTPPESGKVLLLFQPAEETGTGAAAMLKNDWLKNQHIDNVFAYHNLPGHSAGTVLIKPGTFACASTGVAIEFIGKTSHAARPENGISPANAMIDTIQYLQDMPANNHDGFSLVTIVHARLGEEAFGVSPGYAKVMATLRSDSNTLFSKMKTDLQQMLAKLEMDTDIQVSLKWDEPFNAAVNSESHSRIVKNQAKLLGFKLEEMQQPMRWSEDFAEFLLTWPGALFCIGSGESHPQLHNPDYDFPDDILETASDLFLAIVRHLHQ